MNVIVVRDYLDTDSHDKIGKEVIARNNVDWGDHIHWEKGKLIKIELDPKNYNKPQKRAFYHVQVNGEDRVTIFNWCAIEEFTLKNDPVVDDINNREPWVSPKGMWWDSVLN